MEIIEIHDVHGRVWLVKHRDIVAVQVGNLSLGVFVKDVPETIFVGVETDNFSAAYRKANDLITGDYSIFQSVPN